MRSDTNESITNLPRYLILATGPWSSTLKHRNWDILAYQGRCRLAIRAVKGYFHYSLDAKGRGVSTRGDLLGTLRHHLEEDMI